MLPWDHEHFVCNCGCMEHQFVISYNEEDKVFYVEMFLATWQGFFRRLLAGVKYILGHKSKYGHFDEIILDQENALRLADYLDNRLEAQ